MYVTIREYKTKMIIFGLLNYIAIMLLFMAYIIIKKWGDKS